MSDGTLRHNVHSVNSEASPDQRNQTITPLGLLAQQVAQSSIKDPTSNPPTSRKSSPAITSNLKSMGPQSTTSATVSRANPAAGSAVRGPGSDDKLRSHIRKTKSEQNPDQRRHSPAHVGSRTQQVTQASAAGMSSGHRILGRTSQAPQAIWDPCHHQAILPGIKRLSPRHIEVKMRILLHTILLQ